jgi:hypothetical protein
MRKVKSHFLVPIARAAADWRISLRARGRSLANIARYLSVEASFGEQQPTAEYPSAAGPLATGGVRRT